MSKKFLSAALCAASVLLAVPALAQPGIAPRHVVVQFGDLDVTREAGARILLSRIEKAAEVACDRGAYDNKDLNFVANYQACLKETMERTVAGLDKPLVSALFAHPVPEAVAKQTEPGSATAGTR